MFVVLISVLYAADISLSSTCCVGTIPCSSILSNAQRRAKITPPLRLVFNLFNPDGFAINFMQDNLVFVATAQQVGELPRLARVHRPFGIINGNEKILRLLLWMPLCCWMGYYFGGAHSLLLIAHVALLGFLRLWEVLVQILHGDQRLCEVVAIEDDIEPR